MTKTELKTVRRLIENHVSAKYSEKQVELNRQAEKEQNDLKKSPYGKRLIAAKAAFEKAKLAYEQALKGSVSGWSKQDGNWDFSQYQSSSVKDTELSRAYQKAKKDIDERLDQAELASAGVDAIKLLEELKKLV